MDQKMDYMPEQEPQEERKILSFGMAKALKILYFVVFGISLVVVLVYCYLNFIVKPPDVPDETPTPSQSEPAQPTESEDPGKKEEEDDPTPTPPALVRRDQVYTCLIFGMDAGHGNTDTIMVATFDVPAKKIGLDPAVMAAPFITTIVDAVSLLVYFTMAGALLGI